MTDGVLAFLQRGGGIVEHGIHQFRVRRGRHGARHRLSVEAIDDGAQADLACGYGELRYVGEPERVGRIGVEVALDQVLRGIRYLAFVGAAPALSRAAGTQVPLCHDAADDLLGHGRPLGSQHGMNATVAVTPAAVMEDIAYAYAQISFSQEWRMCPQSRRLQHTFLWRA